MFSGLRVTVLRGGPSAERDVSLTSGAAVANACRRLGCTVTEADVSPQDLSALDVPADVVFPVLHGEFGEDGQLQAILEHRRLRYVGSDAAASRLAMDKDASKETWQSEGLPTAPWICVDETDDPVAVDFPGPPAVLKPLREGSSIGVRFCATLDELREEVRRSVAEYGKVLVEKQLDGPELTVGVLEDQALPVRKSSSSQTSTRPRTPWRRRWRSVRFGPSGAETSRAWTSFATGGRACTSSKSTRSPDSPTTVSCRRRQPRWASGSTSWSADC